MKDLAYVALTLILFIASWLYVKGLETLWDRDGTRIPGRHRPVAAAPRLPALRAASAGALL